jgi:hypothetical protein
MVWCLCLASLGSVYGETHKGFLTKGGEPLFPIGFYELPKEEAALREMAASGVNLVHCHSFEDLDRAASVGLLGVFPLPLQQGDTGELRVTVERVKDHPALAVWEGPDEVVWNFTAFSGLHRTQGIYPTKDEWWRQTPLAQRYSEEQAAGIIPAMRAAIEAVRGLDLRRHPFWVNEAMESDVRFVREYMDSIDITGCDIYPVKKDERPIERIGFAADRWRQIGWGKPVWMVLQAFSWNELGEYYGHTEVAYPTFAESRFMAYNAIVHGASGLLYWGSSYCKSAGFRQSLYALTSELAALQPFLASPSVPGVQAGVIQAKVEEQNGVKVMTKHHGEDWLIMVVNEDNDRHMATVISGLESLNGKTLNLLYGEEKANVLHGDIVLRLQPYEVKVLATGSGWESSRREERDFGG